LSRSGTGRRLDALDALGQHGLAIHLHQEVHAAAQVEAEVHRQRVQALHPFRGVFLQVQGDQVGWIFRIGVQAFFQHRLGLELDVRGGEAHAHRGVGAAAVKGQAVVGDAGLGQHIGDLGGHVGAHLDGRLAAGDLHCRRLAEEVRRREQRAQQQATAIRIYFQTG
jgi:hypothetical protein